MEKALESCYTSNWGVALELEQELKNRLAPFFQEQHVILHSISAGQEPGYPVTPVAAILPNCEHPKTVTTISSRDSRVPQLWIEGVTGSMPKALKDSLHSQGISHCEIDFTQDLFAELSQLVMRGKIDPFIVLSPPL